MVAQRLSVIFSDVILKSLFGLVILYLILPGMESVIFLVSGEYSKISIFNGDKRCFLYFQIFWALAGSSVVSDREAVTIIVIVSVKK